MTWWGGEGRKRWAQLAADSVGDERVEGVNFFPLGEGLDLLNDYLLSLFVWMEWVVLRRRRIWSERRKRKQKKNSEFQL